MDDIDEIEVVIAKTKSDLKRIGLHVLKPNVDDIDAMRYEAMAQGVSMVIVYIKPID